MRRRAGAITFYGADSWFGTESATALPGVGSATREDLGLWLSQ